MFCVWISSAGLVSGTWNKTTCLFISIFSPWKHTSLALHDGNTQPVSSSWKHTCLSLHHGNIHLWLFTMETHNLLITMETQSRALHHGNTQSVSSPWKHISGSSPWWHTTCVITMKTHISGSSPWKHTSLALHHGNTQPVSSPWKHISGSSPC